jgi:hypothetical protein
MASVLALFIALGGSAYAFHLGKNSVGSKQLKKNAVKTAKIKNEAVTGAKIKKGTLTGSQIDVSTLGTVPSATSATNATNADNAQPYAFAHVSAKGVLDSANSKNVGSVSSAGEFYDCFSGLPFTPRGGEATVDYNDAGYAFAQFGLGRHPFCPANTQAFVWTAATAEPKPVRAGVFVVFYR